MKRALFVIVAAIVVALPLYLISTAEKQAVERREQEAAYQEAVRVLSNQLTEEKQTVERLQERQQELEMALRRRLSTYETVAHPTRGLASRDGRMAVDMPVSVLTGFTAEDYESAWELLGVSGMKGIGCALVQAEETYRVSSLALAAIVALESGWGTSKIARDKNNLLGIGAYDHDPNNCAFTFSTKDDSILFAADLLRTHYLTPGGRFYNGDSLRGINVRYATSKTWAAKVAFIMAQIAEVIIDDPAPLREILQEV